MQHFARFHPSHWGSNIGLNAVLLLLALVLGVGTGMGSDGSGLIAIAIFLAVAGSLLIVLWPRWAYYLFLLTLLVVEEFPSVQGETVERSTRTFFYAQSLGINGLYAPDVWMLALLGIFIFIRLAKHEHFGLHLDKIGFALLLIGFTATLSVVLSFVDGNPFEGAVVQEVTGVGLALNERALQFIALFHFKILSLLFASYFLTLLIVDHPRRLAQLMPIFLLAACACVLLGFVRLALNPGAISQGLPLFYDSPSSWFFALFAMYTTAAWAHKLHNHRVLTLMIGVSLILMFFVLISFRRTMWGAILFAAVPLMVWLPAHAKGRLLVLGGFSITALLLIVLLTPLRDFLLVPVLGRIEQTNASDTSTLYRLAIATYIANNFSDIPWFGYGARPLWNEIAAIDNFRPNVENVHSLYWWWLLRTGPVGMLLAAVAVGLIFRSTWRAACVTISSQWRVLGMIVFLALLMFLFSGLFNPVYTQVRYVVPAGMALAIASRILDFSRQLTFRIHTQLQ